MTNLARDARYALRTFRGNPLFTVVAVLTLAVGIGANTAIFSVANALLLRPLPYQDPSRLVLISTRRAADPVNQGPLSLPRFEAVRGRNRSFSAIAAFTSEVFNFTGRGDPEQLAAARTSANFLQVLGVRPAIGRQFLAAEDKPGGDPVVLIGHGFWVRRFGSDPAVVGRHITLDQKDYTIVGVLPREFRFGFFPQNLDILAPRVFELNLATPQQLQGGTMFLNLVARLRPGIGIAQAQSEMDGLSAQYPASARVFPTPTRG
jgi:hypothetical protein